MLRLSNQKNLDQTLTLSGEYQPEIDRLRETRSNPVHFNTDLGNKMEVLLPTEKNIITISHTVLSSFS